MVLNKSDQTRIREYLLGKLSDEEQQKLEERLITEDDLFQEFEISKDELVEEYQANELSPDEQQWFESHFLASSEGKERYRFTVTLDHLARPIPKPAPRVSFFDWLTNLFKQYPWIIATASAVVIICVIGIPGYVLRPKGQTFTGPTLASNITNREQGALPARITIPANASELKLRLSLPRDTSPSPNYRAELDNKTETTPVKVVEQDQEGVWVVVPVSKLPRGEYSLKLVAITPEGTEREIPGDYLFNIQ